MIGVQRQSKGVASAIAGLAIVGTLLAGCSNADPATSGADSTTSGADASASDVATNEEVIALYTTMRNLWTDHMQYTYSTVDSFFNTPDSLQAHLDRLLANQKDMGDAVGAYYGQEAGDQLTALLTTHIQQAVPVLEAAQAGDQAALEKAQADWYANAKEIADFLSAANPQNWPTSATEPAMMMHIDQTTTYSVDLLKGDYAKAVQDYDAAFHHMMELSDILSAGIVAQFPDKFAAA